MVRPNLSEKEITMLRDPWDWRDFASEPLEVTKEKQRRAKALGVPAVLFTAGQVRERIEEIALLEHLTRDVDGSVYIVLLKGGIQFATPYFRSIANLEPVATPVVDYFHASRYGKGQRGDELEIIRGLDPRTRIFGRDVVFVDDVIDRGKTIGVTGERFLHPQWTVHHGLAPAESVGVRALTHKRIAKLPDVFASDNIHVGLWTPNVWTGGNGMDGGGEAMRWVEEIVVSPVQHVRYRESLPEVLDFLGARVNTEVDITWEDPPADRY